MSSVALHAHQIVYAHVQRSNQALKVHKNKLKVPFLFMEMQKIRACGASRPAARCAPQRISNDVCLRAVRDLRRHLCQIRLLQ